MTTPGGNDRITFSVDVDESGAVRGMRRTADGMDDLQRLSAQLRKARTAEANAAGQVRVAETRLADVRSSGKAKAAQLAAAEEALAKAQRNLGSAREVASDFRAKVAKAEASAAREVNRVSRSLGGRMVAGAADEADKRGRRAFMSVGKSLGGGLRLGFVQPLAGLQNVVGGLVAGAGLASFFKSAVLGASDLNETISKSRVIFGESADEIQAWAADSVRSMGLTRNQAIGATASFGDMFLQLGVGRDRAAGMSKQMVELAADLASFNNADITQVLEAQSAAFRGEYDSLQRFIPNINAARVEQEALAISHKKTTAELTAQDKVLATQAILMRDSARAQGDFARTSGGTANQLRILQANFSEFLTSMGQEFLPLVNRGVTTLNSFIGPLTGMVHTIADLPPGLFAGAAAFVAFTLATKGATAVGGRVADTYRTLIERGGGVEASAGRISRSVGGMGAAFRGLIASINPVTALLVVGATAVGLYAQKKAEAKARVEDFTRALEADSGAIGDNTRQLVAQRLEQSGALAAAQKLGVALSDVTAAVLGDTAARERINYVLTAQTTLTEAQARAMQYNAVTLQQNRQAAGELTSALDGNNKELTEAVAKQQRLSQAAPVTTGAVKNQGQAAATAKAQFATLNAELFETVNVNADAQTSAINFKNSLAQLTQSVKDNGTSLSFNTQKGRDNRTAVIAAIEAAQRHAEAVGKQTGKENDARVAFEKSIPQIREQARRLGLNKTEVDNLIASIAKLKPKTVPVRAVVSVVDAISARADTRGYGGGDASHGRAYGGWIPGSSPSDRSDNIPARLTAGEFVVQRPTARKLQRKAPGFLEALNTGAVDVGGDKGVMRASIGRPLKFARGGSVPEVQRLIRAQDPDPYIWGAAGPYGFDCSGLVGAAYGMLTGRGGFSGQRYFTTDTIGAAQGFRPGLGKFAVGVTPGRGHMAGQLGSLKFEARSTAAGILVGGAASSPKSFARQFYLPQLGGAFGVDELTRRQKQQVFGLIRPQIAAMIARELRVTTADNGAMLPPRSTTVVRNGTNQWEQVGPPGGGTKIEHHWHVQGIAPFTARDSVEVWERYAIMHSL